MRRGSFAGIEVMRGMKRETQGDVCERKSRSPTEPTDQHEHVLCSYLSLMCPAQVFMVNLAATDYLPLETYTKTR